MTVSGSDICDLATVRSIDLSQYSGVITIEEPDIEDPFRTDVVPQLVLQFHDIDMTMLDYIEPEAKHIQQALSFAQEINGPLLVHCPFQQQLHWQLPLTVWVLGTNDGLVSGYGRHTHRHSKTGW